MSTTYAKFMITRISRLALLTLLLAVAIAGIPGQTQAQIAIPPQYTVFMRLFAVGSSTAINGDSQDPRFPGSAGWFPLNSFNMGASNTVSLGTGTGGAGSGKTSFGQLEANKALSIISPKLLTTLATGAHFDKMEIVVGNAEVSANVAPTRFTFKTVFVTSQNWKGTTSSSAPSETVQLAVGAVGISVTPIGSDGQPAGPPVSAGWSILGNVPFDPNAP
jgi:type VI protein secretion system component Hcp